MHTAFPPSLTRLGAALMAVVGLAVAVSPAAAASTAQVDAIAHPSSQIRLDPTAGGDASRFTIAVLPDTQFYSRYAPQFAEQYGLMEAGNPASAISPYTVQTSWIAQHQQELNTQFTLHLGDIVDQVGFTAQWDHASYAMGLLEGAGANYSILPGNHDVEDQNARNSVANSTNYVNYFSSSRLARGFADDVADGDEGTPFAQYVSTYQDGLSNAYVFEAEGQKFLVLAISWNSDTGVYPWARDVMNANPYPTILTSHSILDIDESTGEAAEWWFGEELWTNLIRDHDQVFLTLNGHFHGETSRVRYNAAGRPVYQILLDSQMAADGGNGNMGLLEFDLTNNSIDWVTISPWVPLKNSASLQASDSPVIDGRYAQFSIDMDWQDRFSSLTDYEWTGGDEDDADYSELAKQIVSEGWEGGVSSNQLPGGSEDYVHVGSTVAHWIFGDQVAGTVAEGQEITDVVGDSNLHRVPLVQDRAKSALEASLVSGSGDLSSILEDVYIETQDVPSLSADTGAVCFADADKVIGYENYLTTDFGTDLTHTDFTGGYTIESFVQIGEGWNSSIGSWVSWLTQASNQNYITGTNWNGDMSSGPFWLALSNLAEYQFSSSSNYLPGGAWVKQESAWSGEIAPGTWHHVAVVGNPSTKTVTMYVDGVASLRVVTNHVGLNTDDGFPWIMGANWSNDEADNGWIGCVGETRVVNAALAPSQFLTVRPNIDAGTDGFVIDEVPAEVTIGTPVTLTGTGVAGATVTVDLLDGTVVAQSRTVEVAENGSWSIGVGDWLVEPAEFAFHATQSIGDRSGQPASFMINVVSEQVDPGGDPDEEEPTTPWTPSDQDLTADSQGLITVNPTMVEQGGTVRVTVPRSAVGTEVLAIAYSSPRLLAQTVVESSATITATVPADMALGEHRLAVYSTDGEVIGWASVTVFDSRSPILVFTGATGVASAMGVAALLVAVGAAGLFIRRRAVATASTED